MFSPWKFNVDAAAAAMLARDGWTMPPDDEYPTGHELVDRYLSPWRPRASWRRTSA